MLSRGDIGLGGGVFVTEWRQRSTMTRWGTTIGFTNRRAVTLGLALAAITAAGGSLFFVGCAEEPTSHRAESATGNDNSSGIAAKSESGTGQTSSTSSGAAALPPKDGGFVERNLEMDTAHDVDYLAMQVALRRTLTQLDPEVGRSTVLTTGDVVVETAAELVRALARAKRGQIVFVRDRKALDLSAEKTLRIPAGVTLASTRGNPGSLGALLFTNKPDATLFIAEADAAVIGLTLMGPDPSRRTYQLERLQNEGGKGGYYFVPTSLGVSVEGANVRVENCELWAWSRAAVAVGPSGSGTKVRHNFIHHNQRHGLGYGVSVDRAEVLIEANLFDWFRHCVAGTGLPGTGYEARYNFILSNGAGHAFDMHGGKDREDGTDIAGSWAKIHHNIVEYVFFPAIEIRGTPIDGIEIYENQFQNPDPARTIVLKSGPERIEIVGNEYGVASIREK